MIVLSFEGQVARRDLPLKTEVWDTVPPQLATPLRATFFLVPGKFFRRERLFVCPKFVQKIPEILPTKKIKKYIFVILGIPKTPKKGFLGVGVHTPPTYGPTKWGHPDPPPI